MILTVKIELIFRLLLFRSTLKMPGCDRNLLKTNEDYRKAGDLSRLHIADEDLHLIGFVIGKGGQSIKRIQDDTRTTIKYNDRYWDRDSHYDRKAYFHINCRRMSATMRLRLH